jgi:large subunit ribosomal protein L21
MFAVIRTGGKQYKVAKDDVIAVEKLAGEPGAAIEFAEVLMVGEGAAVATGAPLVAGASVSATILDQRRGAKIIVFKKKRRKNYRRKKGHRQYETVLRITGISAAAGMTPTESREEAAAPAMPEEGTGAAIPEATALETAPATAPEESRAAPPEQTAQETAPTAAPEESVAPPGQTVQETQTDGA